MQHITVERPEGRPWALLLIRKDPVNSFDTALWTALGDALAALEADPSVTGVVIGSGLVRDVFTAGNDLKELYAPNTSAERYREFWLAQSRALERLYASRLATAAAIRGACPAGGCGLSLCCDARFMTPNGSMGLNEVALGIPVPKYWASLMGRAIGHAAAERLVLSGRMVGAREALSLGLVDKITPDDSQAAVLAAAGAWMDAAAALPAAARAATKGGQRDTFCAEWRRYYEEEEAAFGWRAISDPKAVAMMAGVLKRLSGKGGGGGGAQQQRSRM
ncbi:MAG: enoylCoA hydratase/isomerase [Monoraphidium minutum]|nr:MAG: enoylCoA hydratase/isomerase [Monoraphidium minutum]